MASDLTKTVKKANFVQRLFRKEDGAETMQAVMLVAIGAIVACSIFGAYKGLKAWHQRQHEVLVDESADSSEWGKKQELMVL